MEITEEVVEGTLTIPPGVNVSGADGEEVVVEPEEGEPGIVMEGEGDSSISHIRVRNATGAGIRVQGRSVILNNVEVTGTLASGDEPGHGILVENAPSFEANSISSSNNAGSGLRVDGTDEVVIVHPQFIPAPDEVIGNASRVIVHPQFLVGEESQVIVHPQFHYNLFLNFDL